LLNRLEVARGEVSVRVSLQNQIVRHRMTRRAPNAPKLSDCGGTA
jgi:hypothetical protein